MNTTVNALTAQINALTAQVNKIEKGITDENTVILIEEIANLRDGVGDGFRKADYYAPSRYYSSMKGVKNIRFDRDRGKDRRIVWVKVTSPVGELLPCEVVIGEVAYDLKIYLSDSYSKEVDY